MPQSESHSADSMSGIQPIDSEQRAYVVEVLAFSVSEEVHFRGVVNDGSLLDNGKNDCVKEQPYRVSPCEGSSGSRLIESNDFLSEGIGVFLSKGNVRERRE